VLALLLVSCGTIAPEREPAVASCNRDSDCVATRYADPVLRTEDCYCLGCPVARSVDDASRNRQGWERSCGSSWSLREGCRPQDCARPVGEVGCRDHRCVWVVAP
jgi:hypothetical protein